MEYICNETPYKKVTYNIDVDIFNFDIELLVKEINTYNEYGSSYYNVFMTSKTSSTLVKNHPNVFNNFEKSSVEEKESFLLDLFNIYKQKGIDCDFIEDWFFGKE